MAPELCASAPPITLELQHLLVSLISVSPEHSPQNRIGHPGEAAGMGIRRPFHAGCYGDIHILPSAVFNQLYKWRVLYLFPKYAA